MTEQEIFNRVKEHHEEAKSLGYNVVATILQGSQNYGLEIDCEEYHSDVDTKCIVIPSFDDFCSNKGRISTTYVRANNEHIDLKDVGTLFELFRKANVNILEILFSKYYIVEPNYKDWFEKLRSYGERICSANKCQTFRTMSGLSMEKYKALKHPYPSIIDKIEKYGYDGKQLHHILRIANFIGRYYHGERFKDCLKVHKNSRENMDKAKLNWFSLGTAESLAKMWDDFTKEIKDRYCEEHKNDPIDEKMYEILNKMKVEAYKMAFRKELSL